MTSYARGYTGPMMPAAGPRLDGGGGIGPARSGGGGGAIGGLQTANQGLNQISEAVNQINQATGNSGGGGFGGDDRIPSGVHSGYDYSGGDAQSTFQNTSTSLLKNLGLKKGGKVPSASKRGDGIVTKGSTKGRFV
jgi:hypothetical protein